MVIKICNISFLKYFFSAININCALDFLFHINIQNSVTNV